MNNLLEIEVVKNGLQVHVQDAGRASMQSLGVPVAGPLDRFSACLANHLVGNSRENPVIEIALMGPKIVFHNAAKIAITGADLSPMIDNQPVQMNQTVSLSAGSILSFGRKKYGCRTYLAIRGEWQMDKILGSFCPLPGIDPSLNEERILKKGSWLKILQAEESIDLNLKKRITYYDLLSEIRVLPGPEFKQFNSSAISFFFENKFTISNASNRMGYRLQEFIPDYINKQELISSATLPGTIQVSNEGQPFILLNDAQTTGGYPRIANVITADLDKIGQLAPGDSIQFQMITHEEALSTMKAYHLKLKSLE